jgi:phosphohistidine phosphatase
MTWCLTDSQLHSSLRPRYRPGSPEESGFDGEVDLYQDLYLSDTSCYLDILRSLPDSARRVLVVGHNPDMDEFLTMLTDSNDHMTTAALAQIDLPITSWQELNEATDGRLQVIWSPREE